MQKKIYELFAREKVLRLYSKNYFQLTPSTPSVSKNQFVGYFVALFKEKKIWVFFIILALIFHVILLAGKNRAGAIPAQRRREKGLASSWV